MQPGVATLTFPVVCERRRQRNFETKATATLEIDRIFIGSEIRNARARTITKFGFGTRWRAAEAIASSSRT